MINTLLTKSKNFQKQLYSYLDSRKPNDPSKLKVVKRIIFDVKKNKDQSLLKFERKFSKLKKIKRDYKNMRNLKVEWTGKTSIVVIDDVLNTGKTLIHSTNFFLSKDLKKIQTAVLVNRNHKIYPIKADFKGISLSTSIKEHISVILDENEGVYLS